MAADWRSVAQLEAAGVLLVQDGNHGAYRPVKDEIVEVGIPHVRAADINGDGEIDFAGAQQINEVAYQRIRKGRGQPGDVLFTHKGTVGRIARVPLMAPRFLCSPQTTFWRSLRHHIIDPGYLYAFIRSEAFTEQVRRRMHETDMAPYISLSAQRQLQIAVPSLPEQRAIAEVLGALDDKIESNTQVAGDQLRVSRTWFERLAWEAPRERLDSMIEVIRSTVHPGASPDEVFEHFSIPAFDQGLTPTLDCGRELKSDKAGLPVSEVSVLLSKLNPNHAWRCWWAVPSGAGQAVCSPEFVVMTAKAVPPEWLFAAIAWDGGFQREVLSGLSGSTGSRQRVKPSDIAAAEAPVFEGPVAEDWLAFAKPAFAQNERLRVESHRLAAIRDALLPRLVWGASAYRLTNDYDEAVDTVLDVAAEA